MTTKQKAKSPLAPVRTARHHHDHGTGPDMTTEQDAESPLAPAEPGYESLGLEPHATATITATVRT